MTIKKQRGRKKAGYIYTGDNELFEKQNLYFYKFNENFYFSEVKDFIEKESFDALISEVDLKIWQSDTKNYPNPQFPLPEYIVEGFRGHMYELLKESADHSYDCLTKKNLKASVALFTLDNLYRVTVPGQHGLGEQLPIEYTKEDYEEYDDFLQELREIKKSFNSLNKLLKTIDNIEDFYKFKISIIPEKQPQRIINEISIARKELLLDNNNDLSISSIRLDESTQTGFTSDED
jgi:hypothetical protein